MTYRELADELAGRVFSSPLQAEVPITCDYAFSVPILYVIVCDTSLAGLLGK